MMMQFVANLIVGVPSGSRREGIDAMSNRIRRQLIVAVSLGFGIGLAFATPAQAGDNDKPSAERQAIYDEFDRLGEFLSMDWIWTLEETLPLDRRRQSFVTTVLEIVEPAPVAHPVLQTIRRQISNYFIASGTFGPGQYLKLEATRDAGLLDQAFIGILNLGMGKAQIDAINLRKFQFSQGIWPQLWTVAEEISSPARFASPTIRASILNDPIGTFTNNLDLLSRGMGGDLSQANLQVDVDGGRELACCCLRIVFFDVLDQASVPVYYYRSMMRPGLPATLGSTLAWGNLSETARLRIELRAIGVRVPVSEIVLADRIPMLLASKINLASAAIDALKLGDARKLLDRIRPKIQAEARLQASYEAACQKWERVDAYHKWAKGWVEPGQAHRGEWNYAGHQGAVTLHIVSCDSTGKVVCALYGKDGPRFSKKLEGTFAYNPRDRSYALKLQAVRGTGKRGAPVGRFSTDWILFQGDASLYELRLDPGQKVAAGAAAKGVAFTFSDGAAGNVPATSVANPPATSEGMKLLDLAEKNMGKGRSSVAAENLISQAERASPGDADVKSRAEALRERIRKFKLNGM